MFNIRANELDELRVRLLAAIASGALEGDAAQHALEASEHLKHLSAFILADGDSHLLVDLDYIANSLETAVAQLHP